MFNRKGRGTRNQLANIRWIIEKAREFLKNIYFCFTDCAKPFDCVDHNKLWKILKEIGIPDHLNCLLRNLYAGQEATVRTGHGTMNWFQVGKEVHQGCILSPCLFNLCAEYIMQNARLWKAQAGIKISGRNINNFRYAMTPPLWQKWVRLLSHVRLFATPWTIAHQARLSMRLQCPWDSPGKNTGVGCHFLLQGIFPTQGSNPGLLHCRQML